MSTRYHPNQKAAVMMLLVRNGGDFSSTAAQSGIPEMTIRRWEKQISPHFQKYPPPTTNPAGEPLLPPLETDMDTLKFVRRQIMNEIAKIAASLGSVGGLTMPYQRAHVLSNLLDKIMKLDAHIKPYAPGEMVVRVIRVKKPYPVDDVPSEEQMT